MTPAAAAREFGKWLDGQRHPTQWPTKRKYQRAAVFYLALAHDQR